MTNEDMTQHPAPSTTEQSPVSDENPTLHGSVATEAPSTQEIPDTPQPAQVPAPAEPTQPAKTGSARTSPWLVAFLAVLLVVGSSAATYLVTTIDNDDEVPAAQTAEPGSDEQEASADVIPGEEPVADAAAVILPSVVQIQAGQGVGSGVIYDASGLILTAAHVVEGADTVTVRFADGEQVEGTVLGGTAGADVAVIQVEGTDLPAAELALDDAPQVGQMAIAVGSPWGLQGTVTSGIISAVDQAIPQGASARAVLQTDAAINPGNSGGPLVDRQGRVIGINVSIFSLSGANDGVGFAVPIDIANGIAESLVAGEEIQTAYLGVSLGVVESGQGGALIDEVTAGTGADEAGLQVGDLVISIDGAPVQDGGDLAAQVQTHQPGDTIDLVVVRDGNEVTVPVTMSERPADLG